MLGDAEQSTSACYLIVLAEVVVAEDLRATILESDPLARVESFPTLAAATAASPGFGRVTAALIDAGPADYVSSDLARAPAMRGAAVVLMGDAAESEAEAQGWPCLARPFGSEQVLAALERAAARATGA